MAKKTYHDSAMEYSAWYLDHLLKMEDVMGRHLEEKITQLIDQRIRFYMERAKNRNHPEAVGKDMRESED